MAAALTLTACTSHGVTEGQDPAEVEGLDRVPNASSEHLPAADTSDVRLPTQFDQLVTVEPTWDLPVQRGGDVFLSAEETDRALVYRAVDSTGTVLWTAQRPLACAGFVVTQDWKGRDLAVLTDAETSDSSLSITTASAYDLGSGEQVWGPVEVPGPHTGPGLVFAAPPEGFMGESGESVALDPTTGEPLGDDGRVIGEFDGTGPLLDLESGEVLGETVHDAAHDAGAGITAFLDADGLTVRDAHGEQQLAMSVREGTTLEAVVGALVYLRDGSSVRVHNGVTGRVAQAYAQDGEGPVAVPDLVTEKGAGTLTAGGRTVLATERADEQKG